MKARDREEKMKFGIRKKSPAASGATGTAGLAPPWQGEGFTPEAPPAPPPVPPPQASGVGPKAPPAWKALVAAGAVVLALVIAGAAFAAGYCTGNTGAGGVGGGRSQRQSAGRNWAAGTGTPGSATSARQKARQMVESGEVCVIRGTVAAADADLLTVSSESGDQVVKIVDTTRIKGRVQQKGSGAEIQSGTGVVILARNGADGGLEAIGIRVVGGTTAPGAVPETSV